MNLSEHMQQMKDGTHKWTRLLEVLGEVLIVAVIGWAIYAYFGKPGPAKERGENEAAELPPVTREEMTQMMSEKAPGPPAITPEYKAKVASEMTELAPVSAGGAVPTDGATPAGHTPTAAERAKMMEMMGQTAP